MEQKKCEFGFLIEQILCGNEIDLTIYQTPFFIGSFGSGTPSCIGNTITNLSTGHLLQFVTRQQLVDEFKYQEKSLEELCDDIIILDII